MAGRNASLMWTDEDGTHVFPLYVEMVEQPHALSGQNYQSRHTRRFYPRSHMPGDITVTGHCLSQREYQALGTFIRQHQRVMVDTPGSVVYSHLTAEDEGFKRLLQLYVFGESIIVRGFINKFTLTKKGIFEPAPQFSFPFTVIYDPHAENIQISRAITKYYKNPQPQGAQISAPGDTINPDDANILDIINKSTPDFAKIPSPFGVGED